MTDPTTQYAEDVLSGKIVASRLVKLSCQRHLTDLCEGKARGLKFDTKAAQHAIDFFPFLKLPEVKGKQNQPFILEPWQKFIIGSIFGWKAGEYRRFRTAYIEIGKGNGKSPMAGAVGLYGLVADGEAAAEVYAAATAAHQAGILFRDAKIMVEGSPELKRMVDSGQHNIAFHKTNSFFRPVSAEHRGLDGKRPHMALIDEIHEHPTPMVVDKMRAGTKGRRQALILEITNSGVDRTTVCWRHHENSVKILKGLIENDEWFAFICGLDPCDKHWGEGHTQPVDGCEDCDQWTDESVWLKANPNLGVSITKKYLQSQVKEAIAMPAQENIVKRLNFCLWTNAATKCIPMDKWDACGGVIDPVKLESQVCWGGLDIGATSDFTAFSLLFPHEDMEVIDIPLDPLKPDGEKRQFSRRSFTWLCWFWIPERPVKRDSHMEETIALWKKRGLIRTTPGEVVDYDQVLMDIEKIVEPYYLEKIAMDRGFQGSQMCNNLQKHFGEDKIVEYPQGIISMNAPCREMIELLILGRLHHDGNPCLRWQASNTAAEQRGGLLKFSKEHSAEKIDGIVSGAMALGLAMMEEETVYNSRGILTLDSGEDTIQQSVSSPTEPVPSRHPDDWLDEEDDW